MFTALANPGLIAQAATTCARNTRDSLIAAQNFYNWIAAQSDGDMTGIGVTSGDLLLMRSMAADLNAYANIYHGLAPGGSYVLPYSFVLTSTQVIGVQ